MPFEINVEKYSTGGQATDGNMAHAGYLSLQTHAQNMSCLLLSTAATVTLTRLNITLQVHSVSCYIAVHRLGAGLKQPKYIAESII